MFRKRHKAITQHPTKAAQRFWKTNSSENGSDIDLAIMGKDCTPETAININATLNEVLPIPYFVDVIDYTSLKQPQLKEHIDRVGIEFYKS